MKRNDRIQSMKLSLGGKEINVDTSNMAFAYGGVMIYLKGRHNTVLESPYQLAVFNDFEEARKYSEWLMNLKEEDRHINSINSYIQYTKSLKGIYPFENPVKKALVNFVNERNEIDFTVNVINFEDQNIAIRQ